MWGPYQAHGELHARTGDDEAENTLRCIDRRFATLSAGCPDAQDPEEMYGVALSAGCPDAQGPEEMYGVALLLGERARGESRTMLESYAATARREEDMSATTFFTEFGEAHRATRHIQGMTVVTEGEASEELLKWRDMGYLKFTGKDQNQPGHRVQKMWREFVRQMEKEKNLLNLFANTYKDETGQRLYAQRLRPEETQIVVASIPALFQKPSP